MHKKNSLLKMLLVIIIPASILMLSSCYPDESLSINETDVIMTGYYDSVDFTSLKTYYMSDTVYAVRDDTTDHSLIEYNNLIIETIDSNMAKYGYTRVSDTASDVPNIRISSASITVKMFLLVGGIHTIPVGDGDGDMDGNLGLVE